MPNLCLEMGRYKDRFVNVTQKEGAIRVKELNINLSCTLIVIEVFLSTLNSNVTFNGVIVM